MNTPARIAATALATATLITSAGCLASGSSDVRVSGTYISPKTLATIEPQVATESDVYALLGEPSRTTELKDGGRILIYAYSKHVESHGQFLLLFSGNDSTSTSSTTYVELDSTGTVVRSWKDDS